MTPLRLNRNHQLQLEVQFKDIEQVVGSTFQGEAILEI